MHIYEVIKMSSSFGSICDHEEIVNECQGCKRVHKCYNGKIICSIHRCPETKWWGGETCPDTTNIDHVDKEDPVKEP
jgi:hypothetical protein